MEWVRWRDGFVFPLHTEKGDMGQDVCVCGFYLSKNICAKRECTAQKLFLVLFFIHAVLRNVGNVIHNLLLIN